jgi:ferrous iron transport protein A
LTSKKIRLIIIANDNHSQNKGEWRNMALTFAEIGETKVIVDFKGKDDIRRHLQDLGFVKGESIKLLSENDSGLIILVKGVRIAINRALASKIMVA